MYILNLCDNLLGSKSLRQHRFPFLLGDSGVKLPVDAFYPDFNLVIEYHEKQHSEPVGFFDKKFTISGVSRGIQRAIYDQRRRDVLPDNGICLVEFSYSEFIYGRKRKLLREETKDSLVIQEKLQYFMPLNQLDFIIKHR